MKKQRTKKDELLDVAKRMPPLYHKLPDEDFDWFKSEALEWLIKQPEIKDFIWRSIANRSESSRLITYNNATGTWQGVEYNAY